MVDSFVSFSPLFEICARKTLLVFSDCGACYYSLFWDTIAIQTESLIRQSMFCIGNDLVDIGVHDVAASVIE